MMALKPDSMSFQIGSIYRRKDIHDAFGGQRQGGISTPRDYPAVFLFTQDEGSNYGYRDEWQKDGYFHYTGEGQVGDMKMTRGNLRLLRHAENGKSLMLFQKVSDGYHRFLGNMECVTYYEKRIPDKYGNLRRGFIFKLKFVDAGPKTDIGDLAMEFDRATLESLRGKAIEASSHRVERDTRSSVVWERSQVVATYVLKRAYGFCEACGQPAPFERRNHTPYLEAHHTKRVSDDGPDAPSYVMALCPICHRRVHYGVDGKEYNAQIQVVPRQIEAALEAHRALIVTAAVIFDGEGRVFVAQRDAGSMAGLWEFPGGKLRNGENPEDCVRREIREELRIGLTQIRPLYSVDHDYESFLIRLLCFAAKPNACPKITEHRMGKWVSLHELEGLDLAPADMKVARYLQSSRQW
ncbi:MAG: NUDIX domain-containing protein [Bacillota bacterium]|jgi:5-methylcytosine-specific restriction protein A